MIYRRGFTLVELLVTISIISLLSTIVLSNVKAARDKAQVGAGQHFSSSLDHAYTAEAVAIWNFEENSGNPIDDSGNNYTLSIVGTPTKVNGIHGKAYQFSSASNNYLTSSPATIPISATWTIAVWVKPSTSNSSSQTIFLTHARPYLMLNSGSFGVGWYDSSFTTRAIDETNSHEAGNWYHVAVTHAGNKTVLYVNGKSVASDSVYDSAATNYELRIGQHNGTAPYQFDGVVDEVRVYSQSLVASEVQNLYLAGVANHSNELALK